MKFIADVMLGRLAKRMRLLGFDVLYDHGLEDNDLLRLALEQGRVILTRDNGLASRPLAENHILIDSDQVDRQLCQVLDAFSVPSAAMLTRCSVCNQPLRPLNKDDARDRVPDHVYERTERFFSCEQCGRVYWKGTHMKRMDAFMTKK